MATPPPAPDERVIVEAERVDQIFSRLRAANVSVRGRASARNKEQVEIYSLVRLLGSRPYALTDFPLKLIKRERPDFLLTLNGTTIGVEHTEAITQNAAKEAFLRDGGAGPDVHFVRPASLTEPPKSSGELRAEIAADEMGLGWVGDSVERGWVEAITFFVMKKFQLLHKQDYPRFERTWLVIYDNWTAPNLNLTTALPLLRSSLDSLATWSLFDRVFILDENELVEIDASMIYVYCVNHCR